jgi:hypothetical protein
VGVRSALEVLALAVVAGELCGGAPVAAGAAVALAAAGTLVARGRRAAAGAIAAGLAIGAALARDVPDARLPAGHVVHLPLPARATVVGRVADVLRRAPGRGALVVDVESVDRGRGAEPVTGLVRLATRGWLRPLVRGDRVSVATTLHRPRNFDLSSRQPKTR